MIRVGYVPHSKNLLHPADRRRLVIWANEKQTELIIDNPLTSDVLVLSNAANFGYWLKRAKQPIILDLVDGYLGENPSLWKDIARNIVRSLRGTSDIRWLTYTRHMRAACRKCAGIIVASPEQRDLLLPFNKNIYVILDDHSEIDAAITMNSFLPVSFTEIQDIPRIFWEGFGYTIKHFKFMAKELDNFLSEFKWGMYLVTVEEFPRWGGYIGKIRTRELIKKIFPLSWRQIEILPWSLENLAMYAEKSKFAIIPIDSNDGFAKLKSENKLLSMWTLGLPTLCTDIPSYLRVTTAAKQRGSSINHGDWYNSLLRFSDNLGHLQELKRQNLLYLTKNHGHSNLVAQWNYAIHSALKTGDL